MIRLTLITILVFACLGGCSRNEGTAPPKVHYGEDVCALCAMIVSDERFAAAIVAPADGERFVALYDDIGDMLVHDEAMSRTGAVMWVHDFDTSEWINAHDAHYCAQSALVTPMASGIAAFTTREAAQRVATEYSGTVVDYAGLIQLTQTP